MMNYSIINQLKEFVSKINNGKNDIIIVPAKSKLNIQKVKKELIINVDIEKYIDQTIDSIISHIIKYKNELDCNIFRLIKKLEAMRKDFHKYKWVLNNKDILLNIKKDNYVIKNNCIVYDDIIYLNNIFFNNKIYSIPEKFSKKNNLYIDLIEIMIYKNFNTLIKCKGNHPNLNPNTSEFCLDRDLEQLSLNLENLKIIISSFKIANLDLCYQYKEYMNLFKQFIKQ